MTIASPSRHAANPDHTPFTDFFDWPALFKKYQKLGDLRYEDLDTLWDKYGRPGDQPPWSERLCGRDRARLLRIYLEENDIQISLLRATLIKDPVLDYASRTCIELSEDLARHLPRLVRHTHLERWLTKVQMLVLLRYLRDISKWSQFILPYYLNNANGGRRRSISRSCRIPTIESRLKVSVFSQTLLYHQRHQ